MNIHTTLNFYGRTEEAVKFYCEALEAEVLFMMRFRECPDPAIQREGMCEKIFHATFRIGETELMASDCGCAERESGPVFAGFSLALRVDAPERAERFFKALSDGGRIELAMTETIFASRYGIVIDRFGVSWKVMVESSEVG